MQTAYLLAGFGGQGVMFAGQLMAYAGMEHGYEVTWIPSYGPEMRGGTAHCTVILSDCPIGSPLVRHPQVVIAFNKPSAQKYAGQEDPAGLFVVNRSLVDEVPLAVQGQLVEVRATDIADQLGNTRLTNMVLLGAALAARPVLPLAVLEAALVAHIPAHRRGLLPLNQQALAAGAALVSAAQPG
ncbi:MAG: 2-oxoacid:ferredoxin oxidoreductase subunit gamma [Anaerolineae bacterium]|nr:2-oxoacid:ferredoxin oxidoreductase subunit gamma [Anaerolineae bacterium]